MPSLTEGQRNVALKIFSDYLQTRAELASGLTPPQEALQLTERREATIAQSLRPAVDAFLRGETALEEFKIAIDSLNKRNDYWGFSGIKGQMFFNLVFNASNEEDFSAELKAAIALPASEDIAKSRIRNFASFVRRVGDELIEAGGSRYARPKLSSIPYFLSYFWQLQAPERWPVFYTNSVQVTTDRNLFEPDADMADSYISYVHVHEELRALFERESRRPVSLYDVEHVWTVFSRHRDNDEAVTHVSIEEPAQRTAVVESEPLAYLPDSYVPPIVAIISTLAKNDPLLEGAAKASGTSLARALEKSINAAFTILGFETKLLGQGSGRVQDGLALATDESYGILWDAKARQGGYRMGTDDRVIREYVTVQSRELKRKRHLRNLYYVIVSSAFQDEFDDLIRALKMETDISEICLVEAAALVAMVDAKLRDPRQLSLGPDGLQRLLCRSGKLTADMVREELAESVSGP